MRVRLPFVLFCYSPLNTTAYYLSGKSYFGRLNWKKRFLLLSHAELQYWDSFPWQGGSKKGSVPLDHITAVSAIDKDNELTLELQTKDFKGEFWEVTYDGYSLLLAVEVRVLFYYLVFGIFCL